jgi:hypothetical protein
MTSNIRAFIPKSTDRIVADALDRYFNMDTHQARAAIKNEWPEHMVKILSLYVAVMGCPSSRNAYTVVERTNKQNIDLYADLLIDRRGQS